MISQNSKGQTEDADKMPEWTVNLDKVNKTEKKKNGAEGET